MSILDVVSTAISSTVAANSAASSNSSSVTSSNFADTLANAVGVSGADFVSGRLGVDLDKQGRPAKVIYFDTDGTKLRTSSFSAESILRNANKYGISLSDLNGLGSQLDAAGIGYRPYELYPGTGSDHGVNFDDLIAGGLGTAYDWREDAAATGTDKGPYAATQLALAQALSEQLQLTKHSDVTDERGIDPAHFTPLSAGNEENPRNYVVFNGGVASWYRTAAEAASAAQFYNGQVIDLSPGSTTSTVAAGGTSTNSGGSQVSGSTPTDATATATVAAATANSSRGGSSAASDSGNGTLAVDTTSSVVAEDNQEGIELNDALPPTTEAIRNLANQLQAAIESTVGTQKNSLMDNLVSALIRFKTNQV